MRQQTKPILVQIMPSRLIGAKSLSETMIYHYSHLDHHEQISVIFQSKHKSKFIHENALENVICKMGAIMFRSQYVKSSRHLPGPLRPLNAVRSYASMVPQPAHDAIITSSWRQINVATSFWRHSDVIFVSCVRWGWLWSNSNTGNVTWLLKLLWSCWLFYYFKARDISFS